MADRIFLSGTSTLTLDAKGRFALPVRYCKEAGREYVMTLSLHDPCLWLYPKPAWDVLVEDLSVLPAVTDPVCRSLQRVILGSAGFCRLDAQHRILVPPELRRILNNDQNLVLIGAINKFELWPAAEHAAQLARDLKLIADSDLNAHADLAGLRL